jgi:hypothetical protein
MDRGACSDPTSAAAAPALSPLTMANVAICAIAVSVTWLAGIRDCGLYHRITQASGDAAVPVPSNPV